MTAVMPEIAAEVSPLGLVTRTEIPVPRVNLLPPEVLERRALRHLSSMLLIALLLTAALCGLIVYQAGSGAGEAQQSLSAAQGQQQGLQTEVTRLSPAQAALTKAQATQTALRASLANEVLWSRYLDQFRATLPDGVRFSSVVVVPGAAAGSTPTTGAVTLPRPVNATAGSIGTTASGTDTTAVASMTLSGMAVSQDAVAALLQSLATVKGFSNVYLSSSTAATSAATSSSTTPIISFVITADVTSAAFSHRYDQDGN